MLADEWKLAHSVLSSSMNLGLLHPSEVVEAAEAAYPLGYGADQLRRGLRPPGDRLARVRVGCLLAVDARLSTSTTHLAARAPGAAGVHRQTPRPRWRASARRSPRARPRVRPSHRTTDGARQPGPHRRRRSVGDDRLDVGDLRRRRRVGDVAQRDRHGAVRRRRDDGDQAVRLRRCLHQQDERLVPHLAASTRSNESGPMPARTPPCTGTSSPATPSRSRGNHRMARQTRRDAQADESSGRSGTGSRSAHPPRRRRIVRSTQHRQSVDKLG